MEDKNYRKLRAAFEATQPQVPDDFTGRVMKRIEEQASVPPSNHRRLRWVAAAACILLLAGIGMVTLREDVSTSEQDVADQRDGVPTSKMVVAEQRDEVSMPKLRSQTSKKKFRKRNSLPDTLGTGIWQRRENIETALRILGECEADIERSEQQVRNHIIETTFRATPQPANVILVSDENGDYELLETKRVINI